MATITINGKECGFERGQTILQIANANGIEIPQYCYHDALSIVASCRICLAEVHAPNPRNGGKVEPMPKLLPTCQAGATDGMVVYTESPKAVANQNAVMEYLLINHPLDCPVCDQAGECSLQDYSFEYGRGTSRFEETKVKQDKKDVGNNVYLYSDRCIMCSRCVRFTQEVTGTAELMIQGRGNKTEIEVFPGMGLDNELSANVIDLCPVGALLDKDFLFAQRVWFLKSTPSIDGLTASGDNITVEHNEGKVYRIKPRTNMAINRWWITDEVRYGHMHVHGDQRVVEPSRKIHGLRTPERWSRATTEAISGIEGAMADGGKPLGVMVSPMLSCEDAAEIARAAIAIAGSADRVIFGVGPIPVDGQDKVFPVGASADDENAFVVRAEKAPNARGVRRVLEALASGDVLDGAGVESKLKSNALSAVIVTGSYPSAWASDGLIAAVSSVFSVVIDSIESALTDAADIVLPGTSWLEKAGVFVNADGIAQVFEQAIPTQAMAKTEAQIGLDLFAEVEGLPRIESATASALVDDGPGQVPSAYTVAGPRSELFNAAHTRQRVAANYGDAMSFLVDAIMPAVLDSTVESDMVAFDL